MKKTLTSMAFALTGLMAADALAEGLEYGLRIASGSGFDRDDKLGQDTSIFPFAIGPAIKFKAPVLQLEVNALYWQTTIENDIAETVDTELAIPIIARLSLPIVPLVLDLQLGAGIEPRIHLGTTVDGSDFDGPDRETVMYLPVSVAGDVNLGVATLNLEIRYEHQLTERVKGDEQRIDYLTFFGGVFF
jgi:hypothetical protein